MEKSQSASPASRQELLLALATSAILLAYEFHYWDLVDFVTPFLFLIPTVVAWAVFITGLLVILVDTVSQRRRAGWRHYLPLMIQLAALVLALSVPWTPLILAWDFRVNLGQREEVIQQAFANQYQIKYPGASDSIMILPYRYRSLSKGGEIMVSEERNAVLFFTFRGVLDSFAGFIYRADDATPEEDDFGGRIIVLKKMSNHWFWAQFH